MDIVFPEIADNAPRDEVLAWYNEVDRILNEMLEHSLALEKAAKKKAKKKKLVISAVPELAHPIRNLT
jgi:hypothetical protein